MWRRHILLEITDAIPIDPLIIIFEHPKSKYLPAR
jgi:hypothetical protein